jgi:hypothetical protein
MDKPIFRAVAILKILLLCIIMAIGSIYFVGYYQKYFATITPYKSVPLLYSLDTTPPKPNVTTIIEVGDITVSNIESLKITDLDYKQRVRIATVNSDPSLGEFITIVNSLIENHFLMINQVSTSADIYVREVFNTATTLVVKDSGILHTTDLASDNPKDEDVQFAYLLNKDTKEITVRRLK